MSRVGLRAKTGADGIRRFATRALLAVGGAIAGTAVAWALTTSSASAVEDVQQFDVVTKIVSVDEKLPTVVPAAKVVDEVDEALRAEQQKARAALPDEQVRKAVEKIAEQILPQVAKVVPAVATASADRAPVQERSLEPTFAPLTAPAQSSAAVFPRFTGLSGVKWTKLAESTPGVAPAHQRPLPADPSPKLPTPAPSPVQCTCGSGGSGSAGGSKSAAPAASGSTHGTVVTRALAPSTDEVTVTPGKQPGINPD